MATSVLHLQMRETVVGPRDSAGQRHQHPTINVARLPPMPGDSKTNAGTYQMQNLMSAQRSRFSAFV